MNKTETKASLRVSLVVCALLIADSLIVAAVARFAIGMAAVGMVFASIAVGAFLGLCAAWYIRRSVGHPLDQAAEVEAAHERVKIFFDAMPFPCRLWSSDYRVIDCNDEAVKLFGLKDKAEMLERYAELYPEYQPDGQRSDDKMKAILEKAFTKGKLVYEWVHMTPAGVLIPVESILVRVRYGDEFVLACYTRDLSEYKEMMSEIQRGSNLLSVVNDSANILLQSESDEFELDLHRCMGMIGKAVSADRVCMWKNHRTDGKLYCDLVYDWPGGTGSLIDSSVAVNVSYDDNTPGWEEILSKGNCINTSASLLSAAEQEQLKAHGVKSLFVAPVFVRGEFWGYVGFDDYQNEKVLSDNEASTLRSGSLLIANALLRNEMTMNLQTAAAELELALTAARNANQAKSDFLARMSHEMRTPLNAIIGLSDLAIGVEDLNEESLANLEKINNAGLTLLGTVNDILDISKIEAGRFDLIPMEYDTPSLINDIVSQNIIRIGEKPIEFALNISGELPARLYGDEIRIKQVLNNLLSNAFKYTKEGRVDFVISCLKDGGDIWITAAVKDTGIGIRPEDQAGLFGAYSQVDTAANRDIEGTGLGLQITRRLAEMMDGHVTMESEYGRGSTFMVSFRQGYVSDAVIGPDTARTLMDFRYTDYKRRSNLRFTRISLPYAKVLVVDDVATNLDVAKGLMKPYRMQIDCVTSGQDAIDAIRREDPRYNAVFMDHMMPGMDGIEATQRIREIGTDYARSIPVIALTANAIVGNEEMFLEKGFQAFIPKPVEIPRLDEVIRHWVRDSEQERIYLEEHKDSGGYDQRVGTDRRRGADRRGSNAGPAGLNIDKGVERFGGVEEYYEILRSYAKNTPSILEEIEEVTLESLEDYTVAVHGIKGAAKAISADAFADMAEAMEAAAKAGDFGYVKENNVIFLEAAWKLLWRIDEMLLMIFPGE
ncbi:MAG: ATP-binding protein [Clostridiales bacterium]|nr:ATP-binding protein [Clostridiales bacterium]